MRRRRSRPAWEEHVSEAELVRADAFWEDLVGPSVRSTRARWSSLARRARLSSEAWGPEADPPAVTCRTYVPVATNTLVVGQREFVPPAGITVTNWADASVEHRDYRARGRHPTCREPADLTELVVHETVSDTLDRGPDGSTHIHLILHRDGTFTQHADLAHNQPHANHHNDRSFGFETVNPVLPRMAGAPDDGVPPDLAAFPVIRNTVWAGQDRHRGRFRNRPRHYVRPTDAQLESSSRLIEWATDPSIGHGMNIPRTWIGLSGDRLLFGRHDPLFRRFSPGIYAHGYFRHSDGYLLVLYAWLRIERGHPPDRARDIAIDIAANHVTKRNVRATGWYVATADVSGIPRPQGQQGGHQPGPTPY